MYRNNPHVLWTDCKQFPVHSTGRGPAVENIPSSEKDNKYVKYPDLIKMFKYCDMNRQGKSYPEIPGEYQRDIFQSSNHTCM